MAAQTETAQQAPAYDLVLLLSLEAAEEQRAKVLSDVEKAIAAAGGSLARNDDWGRRPTAFQINHQAEAEYHLLQFDAPPQTIEELSHTLRITDGVLRFRVIKLRPGTPPAPSSAPPVVAAAAPPSASAPSAPAAPAASATSAASAASSAPSAPSREDEAAETGEADDATERAGGADAESAEGGQPEAETPITAQEDSGAEADGGADESAEGSADASPDGSADAESPDGSADAESPPGE